MNGHKSFSLKFYLVLFLGLVPFLNASHLSERGPSIFAKATTDIAFKKMLSDTQVAEALINAFFQSMPEGTISLPIKIKERGEENVPIGGLPGTGSMDFHAITNDDNHIVIEMQAVHHDYFDRRALFYAASTFVKQILPKEDLPEEESTGSRNMRKWYARLKDVYAIQFIDNYRSPSQDFKKYYKMTDVFSQQMLNGIHLIQIELKKIQHIQFPLSDSQASSLQPVDWWYYIMKYSDKFNDEEITRCCKLGMPDKIATALESLKKQRWSDKEWDDYETTLGEVPTFKEEKKRSKEKGELKGQLASLMRAWAIEERLPQFLLSPIINFISNSGESLKKNFVQKVFKKLQNEIPSNKTHEDFISALIDNGISLE